MEGKRAHPSSLAKELVERVGALGGTQFSLDLKNHHGGIGREEGAAPVGRDANPQGSKGGDRGRMNCEDPRVAHKVGRIEGEDVCHAMLLHGRNQAGFVRLDAQRAR